MFFQVMRTSQKKVHPKIDNLYGYVGGFFLLLVELLLFTFATDPVKVPYDNDSMQMLSE